MKMGSEICPKCGNKLDFEWADGGMALKCRLCDYRSKPFYGRSKVLDPFWAQRLLHERFT